MSLFMKMRLEYQNIDQLNGKNLFPLLMQITGIANIEFLWRENQMKLIKNLKVTLNLD